MGTALLEEKVIWIIFWIPKLFDILRNCFGIVDLTKAEFNAGINDFMFTLSGVARDIAKNMETLNQASAGK